jgi:hypothetical protein
MERDPEPASNLEPRHQDRHETIRVLVQAGEVVLKVFLATALAVGVVRTRDIEARAEPPVARVAVPAMPQDAAPDPKFGSTLSIRRLLTRSWER